MQSAGSLVLRALPHATLNFNFLSARLPIQMSQRRAGTLLDPLTPLCQGACFEPPLAQLQLPPVKLCERQFIADVDSCWFNLFSGIFLTAFWASVDKQLKKMAPRELPPARQSELENRVN